MPPRLNLLGASRSIVIRSRPSIASRQPRLVPRASMRYFADEKTPKDTTGPNPDALGNVSEEAADVGKVTGETPPDLEQGTPVQEIFERDEESKRNAPQVIKDDMASRLPTRTSSAHSFQHLIALGQLQNISEGGHGEDPVDPAKVGHKFGIPEKAPRENLHERYDPVVDQVTNLLMRDGKLSVAQRHMSFILNHLRTSSPPIPNPARPLLPGSPPPASLPLDPIGYLALAIDSVAPLLRLRSQKGAAGGGNNLQIPVPLGLRQRRRQAVQWILDVANKKRSRGSGKQQFAQRFADEVISVAEGKSSVWEKRMLVHKLATSARANLNYGSRGRKKF